MLGVPVYYSSSSIGDGNLIWWSTGPHSDEISKRCASHSRHPQLLPSFDPAFRCNPPVKPTNSSSVVQCVGDSQPATEFTRAESAWKEDYRYNIIDERPNQGQMTSLRLSQHPWLLPSSLFHPELPSPTPGFCPPICWGD